MSYNSNCTHLTLSLIENVFYTEGYTNCGEEVQDQTTLYKEYQDQSLYFFFNIFSIKKENLSVKIIKRYNYK